MSAVLAAPDRFATFARADLSEPEKLRRALITARMVYRYRTSTRVTPAWRCGACGGRVDIEPVRNAAGTIVGSTGRCRTTNCLNWEDAPCPRA